MPSDQVLDEAHFDAMTGHDRALQHEVLDLFEHQAALWSRLISPSAPVDTWRDALHSLKGSARGLGLWGLAEACESAEALARAGLRDGRSLDHELARVRLALASGLAAIARWRAAHRALAQAG